MVVWSEMKLLVFAHKPPPHHGQSYMVELMLNGFGGDYRKSVAEPDENEPKNSVIKCYHVDCRLSRGIDDIGRPRSAKIFWLIKYSLEALWCRFRYKVHCFY